MVIAGDFNSEGIAPFLIDKGYRWVTARVGPSIAFFSWDHIFVRHLKPLRAGVMQAARGASDHKPVWAVAVPAVEAKWRAPTVDQ